MYRILHTEWSSGWGGQEIRIIQESLEFMKRGYRMMIACQPGSRIYELASTSYRRSCGCELNQPSAFL